MIDAIINAYVTIVFRILSFLTLVITIPIIAIRELYMWMTMSESDFVRWEENFRAEMKESITGKEGVI